MIIYTIQEGFGMLDNEGKENIESIKAAAAQIWADLCQFGNVDLIEAPYCMFEVHLLVYQKFDILLTYDRSILGINIKELGEYKNIRRYTSKEIKRGFESCQPENLLYNFRILNEILKSM
jgi:hypothetical protein